MHTIVLSKFFRNIKYSCIMKKKILQANHVPYMTKSLRKAIMKRSESEIKFVKSKTIENLKLYKTNKETFVLNRIKKKENIMRNWI